MSQNAFDVLIVSGHKIFFPIRNISMRPIYAAPDWKPSSGGAPVLGYVAPGPVEHGLHGPHRHSQQPPNSDSGNLAASCRLKG